MANNGSYFYRIGKQPDTGGAMHNAQAKQQGFTLLEIAIVLVIIGLLLGAVFKGRELIEQMKIKNTVKKIDEVRAAIYAYDDRYDALPGDDDNNTPTTPNLANPDDGRIEDPQVWQQLFAAGLISGGGDPLKTPYKTKMAVIYNGGGMKTNTICVKVPAEVATQIDKRYDDGSPSSGDFRKAGTGANPSTNASVATTYGASDVWVCTKL